MPATVLVCDNEQVLRTLVRATLGDRGYAIAEARDGDESLEVARRTKPDLIILDMLMPGRSGLEVLAELRRDPSLGRTPVIVLTARAQAADREAAMRASADRFLAKPFSPRELAAMVDELLAGGPADERDNGRRETAAKRGRERYASLVRERVARAEAQAAEQEYRVLADSLPHHVWTARPEGALDYVNRRLLEYGGRPAELLSGLEQLVHPDEAAGYLERWTRALERGAPLEAEVRLRSADGAYRWHLVRAVPQRGDSGEVVKWFGTCTDVHDQRTSAFGLAAETEVARALLGGDTEEQALSPLLAAVAGRLGWDAAALWVPDDGELVCGELWLQPGRDLPGFQAATLDVRLERGLGLPGRAWATGAPVWIEDLAETDASLREEAAIAGGLRSALAVPLLTSGEVKGVLELHRIEPGEPGGQTLETLARVGTGMASFLARRADDEAQDEVQARRYAEQRELKRALAELASEKDRLDALHTFASRLLAGHAEDFDRTFVDEFCAFAEADVAVLYKREDGGSRRDTPALVLAATRGIEGARLAERTRVGEGTAGRALALRVCLPVSYPDDSLALGTDLVRHALHVPLHHDDRELGVLTLGRVQDRPFVGAEVRAIEELAGLAAAAFSSSLALEGARRLANLNRAVLDATDEAIRVVDARGNQVVANAAMERLAGELGDGVAEEDTDTDGDPELVTRRELKLDGRTFQRYTAPVRDSLGAVLGRIVVLREVSAERTAERLREELVATVSHELRTPLTGILGFTEILLDQDLSEESRRRHLETINNEVKRLTSLIDTLLDLERLHDRRLPLRPEPFALERLLAETVALFSGESEAHRIELEVTEEPLEVVADRDRIAQVVSNLLSNSIKYSPGGGVVRVRGATLDGHVRVSVSDEGIGIAADQQDRVFSRFFRADSSVAREIRGVGLGLALSREIVVAHGGEIGFESAEGVGSTFWFDLPAR